MKDNHIDISIVCPVYNEENMLIPFIEALTNILTKIDRPCEIIFINDGSTDNTLAILTEEKKSQHYLKIINLSRNFGKEAALTAGIDYAEGNVIIPIDSDLQDPPEIILELITCWENGYDVVLAKRNDRSTDSFLKRNTSRLFYRMHNKVCDTKIPYDVGDFRLITKKVAKAIQTLPENQRFMKGIFAWVGFKTAVVEYKRQPRKAGRSSFNGFKLLNFAIDGLTGFSTALLRIWLYLGTLISIAAFSYGSFIVIRTLIYGIDVPGYASLLTIILFLGGIQLTGIGIMGEYLGRIFMESKRRPPYIIEGIY